MLVLRDSGNGNAVLSHVVAQSAPRHPRLVGTYMCRHEKAQGTSLGEEALVVNRVDDGINLGGRRDVRAQLLIWG